MLSTHAEPAVRARGSTMAPPKWRRTPSWTQVSGLHRTACWALDSMLPQTGAKQWPLQRRAAMKDASSLDARNSEKLLWSTPGTHAKVIILRPAGKVATTRPMFRVVRALHVQSTALRIQRGSSRCTPPKFGEVSDCFEAARVARRGHERLRLEL